MSQRQRLRNLSIQQRPGGLCANDRLASDSYIELALLFFTLARLLGLRVMAPVFRALKLLYIAEYIEINSVRM